MTEELHRGYEIGDRIYIPETVVDGSYEFREGLTGTIACFDNSAPEVGVVFDEDIKFGFNLNGAINNSRGMFMHYSEIAPLVEKLDIEINADGLL